jgi:hypothetical protein
MNKLTIDAQCITAGISTGNDADAAYLLD